MKNEKVNINLTREEIATIISVIQDWYSSPFSDFIITNPTTREKAVMDIHDKLEKLSGGRK